MDPKIKKKDLERLYEAVLSLKTTKECDKSVSYTHLDGAGRKARSYH